FDFTGHMRRLCEDLVARTPELRHIDMSRVLVAAAQVRTNHLEGIHASLTPLRFPGGGSFLYRAGRCYTLPRVLDPAGREMLYILRFYLPRFADLKFKEKMVTIVHELWHISPAFNGDLRRHRGRCYAHGRSQKTYDAHAARLVEKYLAQHPPAELYEFLQYSFHQLQSRYGTVYGLRVPRPRLIPVPSAPSSSKEGGYSS
ncbi:MAG: putative metallopeptidase, partial [Thermoguttaceae bacterium]|nr:putative metallopeptidase [Thermoguttaceae bacterium]